jgi:hypothetical protein
MPTAGIAALAARVITKKTAAIAATAEMILAGVRLSLLKLEIVIMGSPDYGSKSWSLWSA